MNTKHKFGPWRHQAGMILCERSKAHPIGRIANVWNNTSDCFTDEEIAIGQLLAAAPELLEALIGVVRVADRKTDEFDAARAAIAKAREGAQS